MLTNRVTKRKSGYQQKKPWVHLPYHNKKRVELVELRADEGYLLGWTKGENGLRVYLRYTKDGSPSRSDRKRRAKPSRGRSRSSRERWGTSGDRGTWILQTSQGRMTSTKARQKKRGGIVWRVVR